MPKITKTFGLIQPEGHEKYDVEVQNENMAKIETALTQCMEAANQDDEPSPEQILKASMQYTDEQIENLVGSAPEALDTIHELAGAMAENSGLIETLNNAIGNSAKKEELESHVGDTEVHVTNEERTAWNDSNSKKHSHDNKSILDVITQSLIIAWNDAVEHITDGTRHVTSKDKELWGTVSEKADADSVPKKVSDLENDKNYLSEVPDEYVTQTEMEGYAQPKGNYLTSESDPTVPEWAKEAKKPSYTASEVGADESGTAAKKANEALASANAYTDTKIANLINGAPETMDTLKEVAEAIADNESVAEALNESIGTRAKVSDLTSHTDDKSNPHGVTKSQVGLGNVPNVATNNQTPTFTQATTLANITTGEKLSVMLGKIAKAISDLISHIGSKANPHGVTKSQVGLGNVDNTADQDKSVKYATSSGNANTVNGHTVEVDVPENAEFTDTNTWRPLGTTENTACAGNDSRLSNARPASDVYSWAKASAKPSYTKEEVGLGNVPNVATDDQTPTFTQATTRANIKSGEKLSVILGKIMKFFGDLKTVAFSGSYNDLTNKPTIPSKTSQLQNDSGYLTSTDVDLSQNHAHSNKNVLDTITQDDLDKLDGIATGANKTTVDSELSSSSTNPVQNKAIYTALNKKANSSHGTHVEFSADGPKADGAASAGSATTVARSDHVHPKQTNVVYGTCSTAAATTAKVVTLSNYALTKDGIVVVKFTYAVPASATLNINSKGAKPIYHRGAAIKAGIIEAGDLATFICDGSQYHLTAVDRNVEKIKTAVFFVKDA